MSLAELPQNMIETTGRPLLRQVAGDDVLANLLKDVRVNRCLQFCFESDGTWLADATPPPFRPPGSVSFHIVLEGQIWIESGETRVIVEAGDVVIFPRGSRHFIGAGNSGRLLTPLEVLPPLPWAAIPIVSFREVDAPCVRILCGFLEARVLDFQPLLAALPDLMIARTSHQSEDWLMPAVHRLMREIDEPSPGGMTIVIRLSEIVFIELMRRQMLLAKSADAGWLSAIGDSVLHKSLMLLHRAPEDNWTQQTLATASGVSKTVLCHRFHKVLGVSPMRYLRDWRLYLASAQLTETDLPILAIAERACYGTEAAFSRAFSRQYGTPPAEWRRRAKGATAAA